MNPDPAFIRERTLWRVAWRRCLARLPDRPARRPPVIGVGLIGAGNVARWQHLPALRRHAALFRLEAVYDSDPERTRDVAEQFSARAAESPDDVAQDTRVQAVLVCTPTLHHAEGVLAAVRAGRHILSEKPLTASVDEAQMLWNAARLARVAGLVNFCFRFRPDIALMRQIIQTGVIGEVYHAWGSFSQGRWFDEAGRPSNERTDAAPWKFEPGGGVLLDMGPHVVDLARWLFGEVHSAHAWSLPAPRGGRNEAACGMNLTFQGGVAAQLLTSRLATGAKEQSHLEISGSRGAVRFQDGCVTLWTRAVPRWRRLMLPPAPPDLLTSFHHAIHRRDAWAPDFWDGYKNNEVISAMLESIRTGATISLRATPIPPSAPINGVSAQLALSGSDTNEPFALRK